MALAQNVYSWLSGLGKGMKPLSNHFVFLLCCRNLLVVHKKSVCRVVFLIKILLLQYASEIKSPEMFFLLLLQYNNIVFLNCGVWSQQHCSIISSFCQTWVIPLNRAFYSRWFSSLVLTGVRPCVFRHFALYRQSRKIQECLTNVALFIAPELTHCW